MIRALKLFSLSSFALFLLVPFVEAGTPPYSDLESYSSSFEAVYDLKQKGVFTGYSDGTFRGDLVINRAELAKVLVLGGGFLPGEVENCAAQSNRVFSDVPPDEWYSDYVYCAQVLEWVNGDSGRDTYRPGDPVNLAEAFKMTTTAMRPDLLFSAQSGPNWYDLYVNILSNQDWITLDAWNSASFTYASNWLGSLDQPASRRTVAELLYRLDLAYQIPDAVSASSGSTWSSNGFDDFVDWSAYSTLGIPAFDFEVELPILPEDPDREWRLKVVTSHPHGAFNGFVTYRTLFVYSTVANAYVPLFTYELYSPEYAPIIDEMFGGFGSEEEDRMIFGDSGLRLRLSNTPGAYADLADIVVRTDLQLLME